MYRVSDCFTLAALKTIYYFCMETCSRVVWRSVTWKVFLIAEKKVRMLTWHPKYAHADLVSADNDILELSSILKFEVCKFIHRGFYNIFFFNLTAKSLALSYNTRFNTDVSLSHVWTNLAQNLFYVRVWSCVTAYPKFEMYPWFSEV